MELANQNPFIKGVVGWVDLRHDTINDRLNYFSQFESIKGFRHIVQAEAPGFMKQKKFLFGLSQLEKHNFTYDILIYHHQLSEAVDLIKQFPHQKFVVDHLAKPAIKQNRYENWSIEIGRLASFENVSIKLSGFTTEADWKTWKPQDFIPYFDFVLQHFGAKRLLYGSDWPVCLLSSTYKSQMNVVEEFISKLSATEKQQIMGGNATEFYNL